MSGGIGTVLAKAIGGDAVLQPAAAAAWFGAPREAEGRPVLVAPEDEAQVAAVLSLASEEGWTVDPAGGGGWLRRNRQRPVDVVLTTERLAEVHEYEPADLTFTAGAGLALSALAEITEPHRQWLPLDPPGGREGTLGGLVSTAVPGPLRHLYGIVRDHVLGLTLVAGDGRILRWGGRVVKNVAGFDVTRLVTGSWGTLGVVTSVSGRLFPIPEADRTLVFSGGSMARLMSGAQALAGSPLPLASIELLDRLPGSVEAGTRDPRSGQGTDIPGALVLRLLGTKAQVEDMDRRVRDDVGSDLGVPTAWSGRESRTIHREHEAWEAGADIVLRLALLPSSLPILVDVAQHLLGFGSGSLERQGETRATAHVGAGILRLGVWGVGSKDEDLDGWASAIAEARKALEAQGGSLRISTGSADLTNRVEPWGTPGPEAAIGRRLKAEFDPAGILSPGRLGL